MQSMALHCYRRPAARNIELVTTNLPILTNTIFGTASTSNSTVRVRVVGDGFKTSPALGFWIKRSLSYSSLQAHRVQRHQHQSMPLRPSAGLTRSVIDSFKLNEFAISRSSLGVALGFYDREHSFASSMTHHRMFTNSSVWFSKPSTPNHQRDNSMNSSEKNKEPTNDNTFSINNDQNDSDTSPINQRATNAILSQLSSPPNLLTLSRIFATPYLSYLLISYQSSKSMATSVATGSDTAASAVSSSMPIDATHAVTADTISTIATNLDHSSTPTFALSLFLLMGFTDFLDGYVARTFPSTATVLGTYLDPFADKFLISVMSLTLCYTGALPGMLVGLWVARDVGILGSVYWLVRQETRRKQDSSNQDGGGGSHSIAVMDPQNTPLKVQASFMSKVNTTLQIGLIALAIAGDVPAIDIPPELMTSLIWMTAGTTIGSSLGYLDGSAMKKSGNK